ncbi:TetR/AcrR family transcriptional regulator [Aquihabitans sp. McL0605]|uniref:TetR/AcrR family transcriptional regulator n=1 Tax=Aquihabitans sp. McL0605 TaxID=3415671 RepID=UPI003CF6539D
MDARINRTRTAVMEAATELLLEGGPAAITMDGVVARSGVAKSTLYRHWPTRDALVIDVFGHIAPDLPRPDPSLSFEEGLRVLAHGFVDVVNDPYWKRLMPAMLLLKADLHEIAELEDDLKQSQVDTVTPVLRCGVDEGWLPEGFDAEAVSTLLIGPILMAALTGSTPLTDEFADRCVDHFMAGVRATCPLQSAATSA